MSQSTHLRKYGVETTVDFELYEVDGVDLRTDWVPAAADCEVMKDEGASTQCTNTATDEGSTYAIVLTATEMQAARLVLKIVDAATKVFLDKVVIIETYGHASAMHAFDLDDANGSTLTEAGGTGDHLTAIDLPNQTMDITGNLSGSVGSVTGAVGSVTGSVGSVTGAVGSVTGAVGSVTGSVGSLVGHTPQTADHTAAIADIPTVAEFNARTLAAASYFDPAADTVANVTLVATTTTNTDMRGTDNAAVADTMEGFFQVSLRSDAAIDTDRAAIVALINANEGSGIGDYDPMADSQETLSANQATMAVNLSTIVTDTGELQTDWTNGGRLDMLIDAIKLTTDQFVFTVANQVDANALTGGGGLDAAGVRTAVGLAAANLDTQLADLPTVAEFNARTLVAASYFDPAADAVANVTLVATTTTNTDMRGTENAALASVATEARLAELDAANLPADVDTLLGRITTVDTVLDALVVTVGVAGAGLTDLGGFSTTAKGQINTEADTALTDYDAPTNTEMLSSFTTTDALITTVDTVVDGIQTDLSNGTDGLGALKTAIDAILTTAMTESYAADGAAPTAAQALMLIQQTLTEFAISGTTWTTKKLDGTTTAATGTLDDATSPTSITRAT